MKQTQKGIVMIGIALTLSLATAIQVIGTKLSTTTYVAVAESKVEEPKPTLSHAQEVWKNALEWCESNGN